MENLSEKELTIEYARELKMLVMRDELDDFITLGTEQNWSYRTLIYQILAKEVEVRTENRHKQRVRRAGFPELKYLQELVREELPKDAQTSFARTRNTGFYQGRT